MAVDDPPQGQRQQPHPRVQALIDAAQVGATVRAAGAATVAPGVAVALPAVAAGKIVSGATEGLAHAVRIALVMRVLRRATRRRRVETVSTLEAELRQRFPGLDPTVIRRIVEQEIRFEEAFDRKATKRVEVDLQKAGVLDKDAQAKRIAEILAREKHYSKLREQAMWGRALGHAQNEVVRQLSPLGATWVLGAAKNHTPGCVALAGRTWPWSVLDVIPPPIHTGCRCSLRPLGPSDTVPPPGEAMALARRAMALEEGVRAVADPGEIDAFLAGDAVRPSIARAVCLLQEVSYEERLHPRGRSGRWVQILGKLKAAPMDDITDVEGHSVIRTREEGYSVRVGAGKRATGTDPEAIADAIEGHLQHRATLGQPVTLDNMDENYQRWFAPQKLDGGHESHPRSGYNVRVGDWRSVQQPERDVDGPAVFKVTSYGEHAGDQMFPEARGTEPIREAYRGMSIDEWNQAVERGYIQSDMRGVIAGWEGTNAGVDPQTAQSYLPRGGEGVIAKLNVRPQHGWFTRNEDGYLRTRERVPMSAVTAVSPVLYKDRDEGLFVRPDSTSAKLTKDANDRSGEAEGGGAAGSGAGRGRGVVGLAEVDVQDPASRERYLAGLRGNERAGFVTDPGDALAGKRAFLNAEGNLGVTVSDTGEVGNLFRNQGAPPGSGGAALDHAVANGGTWLNAFDGALPEIYAKHGFVEVARLRWDPGQEPTEWNHERYDAPDVVFMAHGVPARPGNYAGSWDEAEAQALAAKPELREAFEGRLHPRDRLGKFAPTLNRLHTLTQAEIERGDVPGVQTSGTLASGVAGRAEPGAIHLSPSSFQDGRVSSSLVAHEAGHYLVPLIVKDGKVPDELQAFAAGKGRAAGRYGATAGAGAHLFENPWKAGERDLPEEMLADAYSALLHGEGEFSYVPGLDGPDDPESREQARQEFEASKKTKLLQRVAEAAREVGWPDRGLYRYEASGPMHNRQYRLVHIEEAVYTESLHPRDRGGHWIGKLRPMGLSGDQHSPLTEQLPPGYALTVERNNGPIGKYTLVGVGGRGQTYFQRTEPSLDDLTAEIRKQEATPIRTRGGVIDTEGLRQAADGFEHGGLTTRVMSARVLPSQEFVGLGDDGQMELEVAITDETGRQVGFMVRNIGKDDEGLYAYHNLAVLTPDAQGRGFMSALNDHMEDYYRQVGINRIMLQTAEVGGYAWARDGYEIGGRGLAGLGQANKVAHESPAAAARIHSEAYLAYPEEERQAFEAKLPSDLYGETPGEGFTSIADVASYGVENARPDANGRMTWLGKDYLIGRRWGGTKHLDASPQEWTAQELADRARDFAARGLIVRADDGGGLEDDRAFWGPGGLEERDWSAALHPRGRQGRWVEALDHYAKEVDREQAEDHADFTGEDFARAMDGFSHGEITAVRANRTKVQNLYGEVWLNLFRKGRPDPVGLARVIVKPPNSRGERVAEFSNMYLSEAEQNQGFGRAFTDHLFETLREGGVDRVQVESVSVGGYSWARRGFVWTADRKAEQQRIVADAKQAGRFDAIASRVRQAQLAEFERKIAAGEFSSEAELAAFGLNEYWPDEDGKRTWLGKELMIGSHWKGERPVSIST